MDGDLDENAQQELRQAHEKAEKASHKILQNQVTDLTIKNGKLQKEIYVKNRRVARRDKEISKLERIHQRELDAKDRRISRFIKRLGHDVDGVIEIPSSWQEDLNTEGFPTRAIYKKACRVNNQSFRPLRHGLVYISKPVRFELDIPEEQELTSLMKSEHTESLDPLLLDPEAAFRPDKLFDFSSLLMHAPKAVAQIAKYVMKKENPIHVVIRLDVHDVYPPQEGGVDRKTGLPFRFHWEGRTCAINSAPLPKDVLAPLAVCRAWLEIFGTCFYASNTFSFQSLGEFGIFTERIGSARRHRIQSVELWWIGSHMVKSDEYEDRKRYSLRTWALHLLTDLLRLKTLKLFVNESGGDQIRRKHEPSFVREILEDATMDHENNRMRRDLRKALGTDWIYQLRGIKTFQVFDYNAAQPRESIRDISFIDDVRSQVMQPKSPEKMALAKTENLKLLIESQTRPSPQAWMVLRHFLDGHDLQMKSSVYKGSAGRRGALRPRRPASESSNSISVPPSNSIAPASGRQLGITPRRNSIEIKDEAPDVIMTDSKEETGFEEIYARTVKIQRRFQSVRSNRSSSSQMARQVNLIRHAARTKTEVQEGSRRGWAAIAIRLNNSPFTPGSSQAQVAQYQMHRVRQSQTGAQQGYPTPPQT